MVKKLHVPTRWQRTDSHSGNYIKQSTQKAHPMKMIQTPLSHPLTSTNSLAESIRRVHARIRSATLMFVFGLLTLLGWTTSAYADPQITQDANGRVDIKAQRYTAAISPEGQLVDVIVDGLPTISGGFPMSENGALPSVNLTGNLVAIRRGNERVEYTFFDTLIKVESEGYAYSLRYEFASCAAVVAEGGKGGPVKQNVGYGRSNAIVLTNGKSISYSKPFHFTVPKRGELVFSNYLNHSVKRGDLIELEIELGLSAQTLDLLSGMKILAPTSEYGPLHDDGNLGQGMCHFPDPKRIIFESVQSNASDKDLPGFVYQLNVLDHYLDGKSVVNQVKKADLAAGQECKLVWELPDLKPGFYYATISCQRDNQVLTEIRQNFAVNLSEYSHPLTRPDDFKTFWIEKLKNIRAIPFDETAVKNSGKSSKEFTIYDVKITGIDGQPVQFELSVPTAPGPHMFVWNTKQPERHARFDFSPKRYYPEEATYRRWDSPDDNNLLQVILYFRRIIDYLVQRDDIDKIYLAGASRTGPVMFICAALDPTKIIGLDIHVPCPIGMSWEQPQYRGWGGKPGDVAWDQYFKMASYVDAVNHAPDLQVPFVVMYGILDDLAPPQGIEAMFKHATQSPWKRISRDGAGHRTSDGLITLRDQLRQKLGIQGVVQSDDDILKAH